MMKSCLDLRHMIKKYNNIFRLIHKETVVKNEKISNYEENFDWGNNLIYS